jgi:hypothetical protein
MPGPRMLPTALQNFELSALLAGAGRVLSCSSWHGLPQGPLPPRQPPSRPSTAFPPSASPCGLNSPHAPPPRRPQGFVHAMSKAVDTQLTAAVPTLRGKALVRPLRAGPSAGKRAGRGGGARPRPLRAPARPAKRSAAPLPAPNATSARGAAHHRRARRRARSPACRRRRPPCRAAPKRPRGAPGPARPDPLRAHATAPSPSGAAPQLLQLLLLRVQPERRAGQRRDVGLHAAPLRLGRRPRAGLPSRPELGRPAAAAAGGRAPAAAATGAAGRAAGAGAGRRQPGRAGAGRAAEQQRQA